MKNLDNESDVAAIPALTNTEDAAVPVTVIRKDPRGPMTVIRGYQTVITEDPAVVEVTIKADGLPPSTRTHIVHPYKIGWGPNLTWIIDDTHEVIAAFLTDGPAGSPAGIL